jgi:phenylalanyl-tRNA synthetase alpha chain
MINVNDALKNLDMLVNNAREDIGNTDDLEVLSDLRAKLLGKDGMLSEQMRRLAELDIASRPEWGESVNDAKLEIGDWLTEQLRKLA